MDFTDAFQVRQTQDIAAFTVGCATEPPNQQTRLLFVMLVTTYRPSYGNAKSNGSQGFLRISN